VDAFATGGLNIRTRKYAQCGPRLNKYIEAKLYISNNITLNIIL